MASITTNQGYNNASSHLIGYESGRFRIETFSFTIPNKDANGIPILKAIISAGYLNSGGGSLTHYGGAWPTVYFYINDIECGTIPMGGTYPTLNFTKTSELQPGNYTMIARTKDSTYGCYYFPNTNVGMTAVFTIEYITAGVAYINNEPYQCYIGDGTNWIPYSIHIGDGTNWNECGI